MSPTDYLEWRDRAIAPVVLREDLEAHQTPPESLLQQVWRYQRLHRHRLQTTAGESLAILHPGFWNRESGPDFCEAVIQRGSHPPASVDVEIDIAPAGWRQHGHQDNPAFVGVGLHVVWETSGAAATDLPTLPIKPYLDASLRELSEWQTTLEPAGLPPQVPGRCHRHMLQMSPKDLRELLYQAARVRLRCKAEVLAAQARDRGWEQAMWEGLFTALGYKGNPWPMRRLAELIPQLRAEAGSQPSPAHWQARFLGIAGLLPEELPPTRPAGNRFLKEIWDVWWREHNQWRELILPRRLWRLGNVRPANHPQRRLALAAHWISYPNFPARLESWIAAPLRLRQSRSALEEILRVPEDGFWSRHWTFDGRRLAKPQPLLGARRVTDLAVNVILPWLWARAQCGGRDSLQQEIERRYFHWPAAQDNTRFRLARERLHAGTSPLRPAGAAIQQGMLQILQDFCETSNALCQSCPFPNHLATSLSPPT